MMALRSVSVQIMLLAVLPLALLFLGLTLFYAHQRNLLLDDQFLVRVHDLSSRLATSVAGSMLAGDIEGVDGLVQQLLQESDIHRLAIADPMGDVLVSRKREETRMGREQLIEVYMPICLSSFDPQGRERIGEAWVVFDQGEILLAKRQGLWTALALASLLALAVAFVAWRLATRILRPMHEALVAMERLRRGETGVRVVETAENELRQLQQGVNLLADTLENQARLRKEAQDMELARDKALQSKAVRTLFLAHMSHEIRTPLNALVGFVRLLQRELDGSVLTLRGQQYLRAMEQSASQLTDLVGGILDFSRIESGKISFRRQTFSTVALMDGVAVEQAEQARAKGLYIDVVTYLDVPVRVESDPLRLRQVLSNLLSNAIKFCPSGGVILRLMLEDQNGEHGRLRFEVEDSGPGIPEEARARLLEAFEQLDLSTRRLHQGVGLGLAISRGLVEQAGGRFAIEDGSLGGARIRFEWPVRVVESAPDEPPLPVTACLADDRPSFRQAVQGKLARLGWRVHMLNASCEDWMQLVSGLPATTDVLVLRDAVEHGEVGREGLQALLREMQVRAIPVLICTARDEPSWERRLEALGATVIRCPSTQHDFERAISDLGGLPFRHSRKVPTPSEDAAQQLEGQTVLVVDDHPLNREVLEQMLAYSGVRVLHAAGGREALTLIGRELVDVVLLDLHMPDMDGEEVLRLLNTRWPQLPVIMLTADALSETADRLLQLGARAVLHKPLNEHLLFETLAEALGARTPAAWRPSDKRGLQTRFWAEEWPRFARLLREARSGYDFEKMHETLHTLAGTAGLLGLSGLAQAARRLGEMWQDASVPPDDAALWQALWQQVEEERMHDPHRPGR